MSFYKKWNNFTNQKKAKPSRSLTELVDLDQANKLQEQVRSRQRGIYKFYCMISYELTSDDRASRGLDDILADLRAIPHVTIVTVVVANEKVGDNRYIAGLSLKYIPSLPGEFSSPEDAKKKILLSVKSLPNVLSLFKVSSGFERIQ